MGKTAFLSVLLTAPLLSAAGIRDIDFKNFPYRWVAPKYGVPQTWHWLDVIPSPGVRLVDGRRDFSSAEASPGAYRGGYLAVHKVVFGDLDSDGREDAAVDLLFSTGGTANWHYLYVFAMRDGGPALIGILRSGSRADGGLLSVAIENATLVVDFADSARRVADCCSDGFVRVRYKLRAGRFVEARKRESGALSALPVNLN